MSTKTFAIILVILFASLSVSVNFFKPGLPETDDLIPLTIRASAFHQSFHDGHFPVRWLQRLNEQYGYPVTNFLYPLPFYLLEIPQLLGFSTLLSVKIYLILITLGSALAAYWWLSNLSPPKVALFGSLLYLTSPYHLIVLNQRGSLGELTGLLFLPLVLGAISRITTKSSTFLILASLFQALLILSHNSLAFITFPLTFWFLWQKYRDLNSKSRFNLIPILIYLLISLGLSAFFWLPAITELHYTRALETPIANISQYFFSITAYLQIVGIPSLLLLLYAFTQKKLWLPLLFLLTTSFLFFSISNPFWNFFKLTNLIQFPIRLATIPLILSPYILITLYRHPPFRFSFHLTSAIILLLGITTTYQSVSSANQLNLPPSFFETNFDSTTVKKEFTPTGVTQDPTTYPPAPFQILEPAENWTVIESHFKTQEKYLQLNLSDQINITFNFHYFPGWTLTIDGQPSTFQLDQQGRPVVTVSSPNSLSNNREIRFIWQETPIRNLANFTSLFFAFVSTVFLINPLTRSKVKAICLTLALFAASTLFYSIYTQSPLILEKFNPILAESKYLNSQWVNAFSTTPLGDHGLYSWAGWAYIQGENPILINSEMPPLGKYLIGLGILLTNRPGLVGLFFALSFLVSFYFLATTLIKDKFISLIPPSLLSFEPIYRGLLSITMLDAIQLTFLNLAFIFLTRKQPRLHHLILGSLAIGGVLTTKFYATGLLVMSSFALYFFLSKQFPTLIRFLFALPLAFSVHLLSYFRFFQLGNSLRDYLGVQKYIFNFYQAGAPNVPLGSFWDLLFFNRWHVWWGADWGKTRIISASEWTILWPVIGLGFIVCLLLLLRSTYSRWFNNKPMPPSYLIITWITIYGLFLTKIGGWPHYNLFLLPYVTLIIVKLLFPKPHHDPKNKT